MREIYVTRVIDVCSLFKAQRSIAIKCEKGTDFLTYNADPRYSQSIGELLAEILDHGCSKRLIESGIPI